MESTTSIRIPDKGDQHISQEVQYGVVWPDGTTTWQIVDPHAASHSAIYFIDLVPKPEGNMVSGYSKSNWEKLLERRAEAAKLDIDEYRDMHRFVQRTVILSVTASKAVAA